MMWIAYVTLGLAVGLVLGYVQGQKHGYNEGYDDYERMHQNALSERGRKAAATRQRKLLASLGEL